MTEFFSPPKAEAQEFREDDPQVLAERFDEAVKVIDEIQENNKDSIEGRSSFYDVTRNLCATIGPDLRAYEEEHDPEDLAEARAGLESLEAYLEALRIRSILTDEFTEDGADPQLRQAADAEAVKLKRSAIQIYAHYLADKAQQLEEAA